MPKWFRNFYLTLLQYDDYHSSTNRRDFWSFNLTHFIILFIFFFFGSGVSIFTTFGLVYFTLCLPSTIALMVRRMNDIKESRWYLFNAKTSESYSNCNEPTQERNYSRNY